MDKNFEIEITILYRMIKSIKKTGEDRKECKEGQDRQDRIAVS
jgi:hypothetical protein